MTQLPLQGIKIIDLSHSWAGPHSSRILGDYGATVIKVEYLKRLCLLRGGKVENRAYDTHVAWHQVNRNKLSVTLDLTVQNERDILERLLVDADVIIENSRPGVMEKLGYSYQQVREIKPDIIMLSMSGFGQTGPYAAYAGYGAVFEGLAGIQSLTSYGEGDIPRRIKEIDVANGVTGAYAVVNALFFRSRTGKGQHIDLSQLEAATHGLIGEQLLEYSLNDSCSGPSGNRHRYFAPSGCYPCRGSDEWLTITIRNETDWANLCDVLEQNEWLNDERFSTAGRRQENHGELDLAICSWTQQLFMSEAVERLQDRGIPSSEVFTVEDLAADQHLRERGYFQAPADGSGLKMMGFPMKFSAIEGVVNWPGPDLGAHNSYVNEQMLDRPAENRPRVRISEVRTAFDKENDE